MKLWWTSRTVWVNIVYAIATLVAGFGLHIDEAAQAAIVVAIMAVVNIYMRFISKDGITWRNKDEP